MKQNPYMGVAPKIMAVNIPVILLCLLPQFLHSPLGRIGFLPGTFRLAAGLVLIGSGLLLLLSSGLLVIRGVREKRLITTGPFRFVRNPMYSAYIFLIIPGVALLINSWVFLAVSPTLYGAARWYLGEETKILQNYFKEEWALYAGKVPPFFPSIGRFLRNLPLLCVAVSWALLSSFLMSGGMVHLSLKLALSR